MDTPAGDINLSEIPAIDKVENDALLALTQR